jgi:large subunit ribosomal protein L22
MEVTAKLRHLQASPQKVRLVVDLIRGKKVDEAVGILKFTNKRAAEAVEKLVKSAVANAESRNEHLDVDSLFVKEIFVDGGPVLKRVWFTTMGRAYRKVKRQSHITIKLATSTETNDGGRKK